MFSLDVKWPLGFTLIGHLSSKISPNPGVLTHTKHKYEAEEGDGSYTPTLRECNGPYGYHSYE